MGWSALDTGTGSVPRWDIDGLERSCSGPILLDCGGRAWTAIPLSAVGRPWCGDAHLVGGPLSLPRRIPKRFLRFPPRDPSSPPATSGLSWARGGRWGGVHHAAGGCRSRRGSRCFRFLPACRFSAESGGARLGFSSIRGLNRETDVVEYREGTDRSTETRKVPGISRGDRITLVRGSSQGTGNSPIG
ncbi:MAG: hypothetical protein EA422_16105 [Gemmatimonadales bacterium]|nr:MAG: hypothetical protein EA422_16105 [Gemmatimonadales bacterium]